MWRQCLAVKRGALRKVTPSGSGSGALSFGGGEGGERGEGAGRGGDGHEARERPARETPGGALGFVSPSGTTCVGGGGAQVAGGAEHAPADGDFLSPPSNATADAESEVTLTLTLTLTIGCLKWPTLFTSVVPPAAAATRLCPTFWSDMPPPLKAFATHAIPMPTKLLTPDASSSSSSSPSAAVELHARTFMLWTPMSVEIRAATSTTAIVLMIIGRCRRTYSFVVRGSNALLELCLTAGFGGSNWIAPRSATDTSRVVVSFGTALSAASGMTNGRG